MEARREKESGVKKNEKDNKPNENDNKEYNDDEMIVGEEDSKKEKDITKPTEKKDLNNACESWIKKVEEFQRGEETSCVDNCNWNKIQVRRKKVVECCLNHAEDGFATRQFDPGRPYNQNRVSLEHACKSWKKKINRFLRRSKIEQKYLKMNIGQKKFPVVYIIKIGI
ncbi:hypothetical protein F8M41_011741 [Gigaspora margarita]|uniref:Uncharacterized protein n=1 Tax=Gigaspora margarita TaxID=4874 RepID=A0A8H4EV73_GIGMA|nr:hypothetical protein F8M41_011741 [Gigaspora margarita]